MMKVNDFIEKAKEIEKEKTIYVMGGLGFIIPHNFRNSYWAKYKFNIPRLSLYDKYKGKVYAFDCVGLIKAILWGWDKDTYSWKNVKSGGVPDINADMMLTDTYCNDIAYTMDGITKGEVVGMKGHIGIYIGDGKVIECTPKWKNCVQITGLNQRRWTKRGKLKWVDYSESVESSKAEMTVEEAKRIVKREFMFSDMTMNFLSLYRYGDELLIRMAKRLNEK